MSQSFSKFIPPSAPIYNSCIEYVHPWTDSCLQATCGLYLYCIFDSLRIYGSVYMSQDDVSGSDMVQVQSKFSSLNVTCGDIHHWNRDCLSFAVATYIASTRASAKIYVTTYLLTLLMKGRIPSKEDIRKTIYGILQSTAFLSGTGFGYSLFLCSLRKVLGHFNILSVSALPAFLASVFAILIERPSRRPLLCLYVSNVATETVWNMLLSRNMVRNVKYGDIVLFSSAMALLLMYYKAGYHKDAEGSSDSMFRVLKFVVGPYEEKDYSVRSSQASSFYRQQVQNSPNDGRSWNSNSRKQSKNPILNLVYSMLRIYKKIVEKIKCGGRDPCCPHPFSCLYYTFQGAGKMFSIGLGIQLSLKLILNSKKILQSPRHLKTILWKREALNLASFLGAFSGIFRAVSCVMRRATGKDSPSHAIPAGLLAGIAFARYPDTTVSLYVLWKAAQITYNLGIQKGVVPKVPGFTEFLYCFSTAILFHAALLEPTALRPSYWKFLHSISGGRIACMSRDPLEVWGLNTKESLRLVLEKTKTVPVVHF